MERGKRIEAVNGEIPLPEVVIQHIQSFLNGKQAAQTSILSKSWYNAWLTSPSLDFDGGDFQKRRNWDPRSQSADGFSEFAKKTMRRYQELNLTIENFRLCMKSTQGDGNSLANELIVKALKMGVNDLNFELHPPDPKFVLPHVVLGAETLVRLSVNGCQIDRRVDGKVSCSRLKSLSLCRVCTWDDLLWEIISSCPLMEKLLLSECTCLVEVKKFNYRKANKILTLRSPSIESGKRNVGLVVDGPIKVYEFSNLNCLLLERVKIDTFFFHDFSLKFPRLEDFTLHYCYGYKRIQISSHSLKCISVAQTCTLKAWFDVPNIQKFNVSGSTFPSLSFTTASREWESNISIR